MNIRIRAVACAIFVLAMVAVSPSAFCATVTWDAGGTSAATLNRPLLNQGTINFAAVSS